jgi:four helix bundle protein
MAGEERLANAMHYRELTVWRKAMDVAVEVYRLVPKLPREETYGMRSQLTRAAVSVPANIAEGWTRESAKEKAQFLAVAQGSLAETDTLLILCEELGWFPVEETVHLRSVQTEVGKMLSTMRRKFREIH